MVIAAITVIAVIIVTMVITVITVITLIAAIMVAAVIMVIIAIAGLKIASINLKRFRSMLARSSRTGYGQPGRADLPDNVVCIQKLCECSGEI